MTSTQPTTAIRAGTEADADAITATLTDAFLYSPVGDWLIPDPAIRRSVYRKYFRIHVDHAGSCGTIDVTTKTIAGVALWFPRRHPSTEPDNYQERLAAACGAWLQRFQVIDAIFDERHPDTPHHYLAFLGVAPELQGQGIGSVLLNHHHAHLDAQGIPAYLEASTERSRDLYLRHGYALAAKAPMTFPDNGPPIWPMWREPAGSS